MKLAKVLEFHRSQNSDISLQDNLGDAYLLKKNKIYFKIREQCLKFGFKFTANQNLDYLALPLSQLNKIMQDKDIPYLGNVKALDEVESKIPSKADWDDVSDGLRKNFIFHESCHAVAHQLAGEFKLGNKVLTSLIQESFANTCELLAVVYAEDRAHEIFYEWNSYTALFEDKKNLQKAMNDIGEKKLFKLLLLGYVHSNYLFQKFDEKQWARLLSFAGGESLNPPQLKTLKAQIKHCFSLDERFKLVTTKLYMQLSGNNVNPAQLSNFSYFAELENDQNYRNYIDKIVAWV